MGGIAALVGGLAAGGLTGLLANRSASRERDIQQQQFAYQQQAGQQALAQADQQNQSLAAANAANQATINAATVNANKTIGAPVSNTVKLARAYGQVTDPLGDTSTPYTGRNKLLGG